MGLNGAGRFRDKACLVTGTGSGIGRATAKRFASEGGKVTGAELNEQRGNETVCEITKDGGEAIFVIDATVRGRVVNDAATMTFKPIVDLLEEDLQTVSNVNLRSVFLFCKHATPHMQPGGSFVNVSCVHAHETTRNVVPYASSKGGMESFTRGFSEEIAPRKLRINGVAPGAVDTPMLWNNPDIKKGTEKVQGAVGEPEDIAAAICFLASAEARFINGTTLVVDGGRLDIL